MFLLSIGRLLKRSKFTTTIIISILILVGIGSSARAATIVVSPGGDFQAALNATQCGDVVVLQAGATWDAPGVYSPFTVPNRGCSAANPITVRSSASGSLPAGRVSPADAPN